MMQNENLKYGFILPWCWVFLLAQIFLRGLKKSGCGILDFWV